MSTALWVGGAWLIAAVVVCLVLGRIVGNRDKQVPHDSHGESTGCCDGHPQATGRGRRGATHKAGD